MAALELISAQRQGSVCPIIFSSPGTKLTDRLAVQWTKNLHSSSAHHFNYREIGVQLSEPLWQMNKFNSHV